MYEKIAGTSESLWDVKDVALYLRASKSWVYKAAEKGAIPSIRVGALLRFSPSAIREHVAALGERGRA